jgi:two-component system nitrate/nitrite sensor histidine kinase NarX
LTLLLASDARDQAQQQVLLIDETLAEIAHGDPQRLFLPPSGAIPNSSVSARPGALPCARLRWPPIRARARQFGHDADTFAGQVDQLVRLIEHDSEQRTFWLRASQLVLVGMAVVGTVSMIYLMFMLIIEPVTRLRLGMQRMKERDFSVRLAVESNDEFGQLASGFNQMADRLQALYGNLEEGCAQDGHAGIPQPRTGAAVRKRRLPAAPAAWKPSAAASCSASSTISRRWRHRARARCRTGQPAHGGA